MCLAKPKRAFYYAFICTLASVLGALLGYAIGFFLFDTVGKAIPNAYGLLHQFDEFGGRFNEQGWIIVMLAGFRPSPFKVITLAAGKTKIQHYILIMTRHIFPP